MHKLARIKSFVLAGLLAAPLLLVPNAAHAVDDPPAITSLGTFVGTAKTEMLNSLWIVLSAAIGLWTIMWAVGLAERKFNRLGKR